MHASADSPPVPDEPKPIHWEAQTKAPHDPLAIVLEIEITIGAITRTVRGTFDTGADITELEPPYISDFAVNEDECGFTQQQFPDGKLDTEPLVMAEAALEGHSFPMPVSLLKYPRRAPEGTPINVFGRAGLMDHFRIQIDPAGGTTTFVWIGKSPKSRLDEIQKFFIDERVGKAKSFQRPAAGSH